MYEQRDEGTLNIKIVGSEPLKWVINKDTNQKKIEKK